MATQILADELDNIYEYLEKVQHFISFDSKKDCERVMDLAKHYFPGKKLSKAPLYLVAKEHFDELESSSETSDVIGELDEKTISLFSIMEKPKTNTNATRAKTSESKMY